MADTVKKSRIVSENKCLPTYPDNISEESSLQDIINEEFNQRLKTCMREESPIQEPNYDNISLTYTPNETVVKNCVNVVQNSAKNGLENNESASNSISDKNLEDNFVNREVLSLEDDLDTPFDKVTVTDVDNENLTAKERFLSTIPDLTEEGLKLSTVKDRMFLSTDSACLLFTQTVVQSPMLTPTEESYDFLQGLKQDSSENVVATPDEVSPVKNEEIVAIFEEETVLNSEETNADLLDYNNENVLMEESNKNEDNLENITISLPNNEDSAVSSSKIEESILKNEDNLECVEADEDRIDISEISAENEVCLQLETSNSENDLSEAQEDIKEATLIFLEHEKSQIIRITPTIVEHLVEDLPSEEAEDQINETALEEIEEISDNNENQNEEQKSASKVSEISKIFSSMEETLKEEIKSPILEETFDDIRKTKELFEKKSVDNEDNVLKSCEDDRGSFDKSSDNDSAPECDTNSTFCPSNLSSTITNESTFVETRIDSNSSQDKVLKKKKSKKSKKDNEKENISVCDYNNTNDEDLSHVSVKTLCRSFSDLTSISSKNVDLKFKNRAVYGKSSFSKFDALQKKTVLHVRSSDSGKAQEKFNGTTQLDNSSCKSCGKQVFQMEQIKAEKAIWHKNCFRCQECKKQLTVDIYQSNEGVLYCKPHFKALFAPKVVEEEQQPIRPRKHEMIIRENQPLELPPDVVRASDKPDLGLEELQNLNVKERFQVFENHESQENNLERTSSAVNVKRSPSILSKLAKFQSKGMDVGVADDSLNGIPVEESSSGEEEDEDEIDGEDADLVRAKRAQREKPLHFNNMSDIMSKWESGHQVTREERREERKQEIQSIRSRLFMGKQAKIKEMYQQAVAESESGAHVKKQVPLEIGEGAMAVREKFERGEPLTSDEQQKLNDLEDRSVFESGISKKSRSIFLELDANASKPPLLTPLSPSKSGTEVRRAREAFMNRQTSEDVVRSSDQIDDVSVKTADISSRFKFFETYKEPEKQKKEFRITPPREGEIKMPDSPEEKVPEISDEETQLASATATHTATRMLNVFRQMEENLGKETVPAGPRPLKRFTPPPEPARQGSDSESGEYTSEEDEEDEVEEQQRIVDEDLVEAQKAARAKQLRAKFEKWEANELKSKQNNSSVNIAEEIGDGESQIESAKSLRARFESMRESNSGKERTPKVKVNRFVDTTNNAEICRSCQGRVYPLEKVSCHNNVYHKNCFRCRECNTILRMDSYTYNQGLLYCLPHFKRLFISKGNYEAGFGLDQHKEKWNSVG